MRKSREIVRMVADLTPFERRMVDQLLQCLTCRLFDDCDVARGFFEERPSLEAFFREYSPPPRPHSE